jgi:hypothetical protein
MGLMRRRAACCRVSQASRTVRSRQQARGRSTSKHEGSALLPSTAAPVSSPVSRGTLPRIAGIADDSTPRALDVRT